MVRVKTTRQHKKKILKRAKGFTGSLSRLFRPAKQAVMHALAYATADRRTNKGNFRKLWIARVGAKARELGISYNKLIAGLKKHNIQLNRKMLSEIAISDSKAFEKLVELIKK